MFRNRCPISYVSLDRKDAILVKVQKPLVVEGQNEQKDHFYYLKDLTLLDAMPNYKCPFTFRDLAKFGYYVKLSELPSRELQKLRMPGMGNILEEDITALSQSTSVFTWKPISTHALDRKRAQVLVSTLCNNAMTPALIMASVSIMIVNDIIKSQPVNIGRGSAIFLSAISVYLTATACTVFSIYRNNLFGFFAGPSAYQRGQTAKDFLVENLGLNQRPQLM